MRRGVESLMADSSDPDSPLVQVFATSISQRPVSYTDHPRRLGVTPTGMTQQLRTNVGPHLKKASD